MIKVFLIFATITLIAVAVPLNVGDVSSERYITIYDTRGKPEVIDLSAPLPETLVSTSDITLYLFTRKNPSEPRQLSLDVNAVASADNFDKSKNNVFIVHGWTHNNLSEVNLELRAAYLQVLDVNVFVVDWSGPASKSYISAFTNVPKIGRLLGEFIGELQNNLGLDASQFLLVGHSLGAHVAGCAGAAANGNVGVIVGLDPAGPGFLSSVTNNRLDPTDAQFVQAIHTHTALFGYSRNLGTVDIRPNGGRSQPGCDSEIWCSHLRSYQLLAESITSGGFSAWVCENYSNFINGMCYSNARTALGGANIDVSSSGEFFLVTNSESPYSRG
ncbi:pancreatic triacylglycerol lipase-like [Agrilus planipennis]|uniref:Pancreatic triacylglycerol lipase-like n=1 Tax=Agrilus planipennis TaxID=224129 RepID=A0A1W4X462_AGRPL|nr:pancreatic triacylglycerol lipase-like [Agrilus planipennis]